MRFKQTKTKQIASVSKDQTEISSISRNTVSNENTNSENILNIKQNQEADVNSTKHELDQKIMLLFFILFLKNTDPRYSNRI